MALVLHILMEVLIIHSRLNENGDSALLVILLQKDPFKK